MAIKFDKIRYKNILSTGNAWTEIVLDNRDTTLFVGQNGAGKSTILDALCFGLYNKPFRKINKPQLINSINKRETEVEVYFRSGGHEYLVKRGMKPNYFEVWKNGKLVNQDASAKDYQAYLEETVLKMNFKSFGQIVVLGSSTFVPFMQLTAASRREVIEDLLDIQVFTTMNTLLKSRVAENKESLAEINHHIDMKRAEIKSAKQHNESIKKIRDDEVKRIRDKLKEQIGIVEDEKAAMESLMDQTQALSDQITDKAERRKLHSEILDAIRTLSTKHEALSKEVKFYENHDNCPTCKQGIDHDFKDAKVSQDQTKLQAIVDARRKLEERGLKIEARLQEIADVESEISALNLKANEHRANANMAMRFCKDIKDELENAEKEADEIDIQKIESMEADLKRAFDAQGKLINQREVLATASAMLKDGGIKTSIVKQYVPIMNKLINKYLADMDFFVQFELDENFNETIKSRFRDEFSYASFSEGEKLRIDLALLFTWRAVSKLRNSVTTNLLIMDEIMDSSLDDAGTEEFLRIIKDLTNDSNVFIISHKGDQLLDKFDGVLCFEKVKGFSIMSEIQ